MSRDQLDILFKQYENAFDKLDIKEISNFCADNFISASSIGTIARSKEEYINKAEQDVNFYKSVGRKSARIVSKRIVPICDKFSMVVIRWGILFEKSMSKLVEFDITYIVYEDSSNPKIMLLILHEDERSFLQRHGIRPRP